MRFKDLLNENWVQARKLIKVKNPLFHATKNILPLQQMELKASSETGGSRYGGVQTTISTTRNINVLIRKQAEFGDMVFVLDGDLIKKNYKVGPFQYGLGVHNLDIHDESEERIYAKKLPLKRYLKGIIMLTKKPMKGFIKEWASWREHFKLPFDVVVYDGKNYQYAKDMI